MAPAGPLKLVTVNTAPERAKRLIGRVVEDVKDRYTIIHAANAPSIDEVKKTVEEAQPNVLFTASMWTSEEAEQIIALAREIVPDLKTFSLPQGLQVEKGPDAVVEYIKENLPSLLG
ncbi:Alpha beta fold family protein [Madurella fahalii]|uniref:Alpha beta fold family protein n=1 Tax=Madurella fahalii TaxID=1157608 RepID=A0ABQ0GMS7_9PEZI